MSVQRGEDVISLAIGLGIAFLIFFIFLATSVYIKYLRKAPPEEQQQQKNLKDHVKSSPKQRTVTRVMQPLKNPEPAFESDYKVVINTRSSSKGGSNIANGSSSKIASSPAQEENSYEYPRLQSPSRTFDYDYEPGVPVSASRYNESVQSSKGYPISNASSSHLYYESSRPNEYTKLISSPWPQYDKSRVPSVRDVETYSIADEEMMLDYYTS